MKERNKNNHPFLALRSLVSELDYRAGRKHNKEFKLKISLSSRLSSLVKLLDIETGKKKKLFNYNLQAANLLNISEWTIRKYK